MILLTNGGDIGKMESKNDELANKVMRRKKEVKIVRKIVAIITLIFLLCSAIVGIGGYLYVNGALEPVNPDAKKVIKVEIPIGSGINTIAATTPPMQPATVFLGDKCGKALRFPQK